MNKREASKAETRALVLVTAHQTFEAVGYEKATIREIAKRAGKSTGAVFMCWESKSALFAEIYGVPPLCPVQAVKLGLGAPVRAEAA